MEKCHKQDVAPIECENERDENYKSDNPQIDSSKTKYNYHMHNPDGTYTEFINKRITELNLSPRKDAVVMNSIVVGADKAFFDGLSKLSQYNFFSDCTKFFEETLVLLSHKKADSHISVNVEFGEGEGQLSLKKIDERAEARKPKERVTYKMVQDFIEEKYGFKVHTSYIAEVKRSLGLPMYDAPNAVEERKHEPQHPTPEMIKAIKDALNHFQII